MKKRHSLFLSIILILFLLCGCGQEPETPAETPVPAPAPVPDPEISVRISEVMSANKTVLTDEQGNFPDWIELFNAGNAHCNLEGCWLSNDPSVPKKWQFPSLVLAPGERCILFCAGKNASASPSPMNVSFALKSEGDTLIFSFPSGNLIQCVELPSLENDTSFCIENGSSYTTRHVSPGYENTLDGYEAFLSTEDQPGELVINEACVFNDSYHELWGGFYDWIELKNNSDHSISLGDYCLTDNSSKPAKYPLPGKTLAPGDTFVLFCVGNASQDHFRVPTLPFALSAAGDTLFLYRSDGTLCDRAGLYDLPLRGSIGRLDGQPGLFLFETPSPENANQFGCRFQSSAPTVVKAPGVYNDIDHLNVELQGNGQIYYTLDGSVPTVADSHLYTAPFSLSSTTAVRAICVETGKVPSAVATFSYIINENHTLPVVMLSCNAKDFSHVYRQSGERCDANLSYFGGDGSFSVDCDVDLHGASSRMYWEKKTFQLTFRNVYGGDLQYDLFGTGEVAGIHSINLRGCDTGWAELHMYKDELAALVANRTRLENCDPLALDSRYCILYVNDEYWGIYALREAYSNKYAATHLGGSEEDYTILKQLWLYNKSEEFSQLYNYICKKDLNSPEAFAYVDERFDLRSFAQWMCFESYFNNNDAVGNIRFVRSSTPGSKWMVMLFDFDIAFGNNIGSWSSITSHNTNTPQTADICLELLESAQFREILLQTAADLLANGLSDELLLETFDSMRTELEPEMNRNLQRWGEARYQYDRLMDSQRNKFSGVRTSTWLENLKVLTKSDKETMHKFFPAYY